jgi:hypothetical protein
LSPRASALMYILTQLLIAWVCVPAWSLWQVFGPQRIKNIEEGLVFPPLTTVVSPILLFSLLTAFVASVMSALSQIILPRAIRHTPPDEPAKWETQQTVRTKTRVVYLLQMTSCVLYQAVVSCNVPGSWTARSLRLISCLWFTYVRRDGDHVV